MTKNDIFGWDLLYKVTQPQIRNNQDVVMCLVHWKLIHEGFRCVGVGEDTTQPNTDEQSEVLPEGWNAAVNKYTLRYLHNNKLYLLNAIVNDNSVVINLNRVVDNQVTGTVINTDVVKEKKGPLVTLIPSFEDIINRINKELISPMVCAAPSKEVHTQTPQESVNIQRTDTSPDPNFFTSPFSQTPHPLYTNPLREIGGLGGLGRSDLDPFAPPGRGMLFQPPGFGPRLPSAIDPSLPMGAVPPGARYDPFGPPASGPQRGNPDHDHLPPPGYDDMFM